MLPSNAREALDENAPTKEHSTRLLGGRRVEAMALQTKQSGTGSPDQRWILERAGRRETVRYWQAMLATVKFHVSVTGPVGAG